MPRQMESINVLQDIFSEDVVLRMCLYLPGKALLDLSVTCRSLRPPTNDSCILWRSLCHSLLGEALVHLHQDAWAGSSVAGHGTDVVVFLKALFRAAYACQEFAYSLKIRRLCIHGSPSDASSAVSAVGAEVGQDGASHSTLNADVLRERTRVEDALAVSGPISCTVGTFVVNIGGTKLNQTTDQLNICVIDLIRKQLVQPRLAANSSRPGRRTRASACVIRPNWSSGFVANAGLPPVLVLGGCDDATREPCGGLNDLLLLEFTAEDASEVRWVEKRAEGQVPRALWHHVCGAFAEGKKVVVFGGDMQAQDPEFAAIADRTAAAHVYLLHVDECRWDRVVTTGTVPIWRSLHKGVTYNSLVDSSECLVIVGGSVDHVALHGHGDLADMVGYALHLGSFEWRRGPMPTTDAQGEDSECQVFVPAPRMRFAADRYGHHLLVYGGHGEGMRFGLSSDVPHEHQVLKMNLTTLNWSQLHIKNRPHSYENMPGAALSSGVLTGGFTSSPFGVQLVPKLDFLCLSPPEPAIDGDVTTQEDEQCSIASSDSDSSPNPIVFRAPDGTRLDARMPHRVFEAMVRMGILRESAVE